jgi:hypothetical protein
MVFTKTESAIIIIISIITLISLCAATLLLSLFLTGCHDGCSHLDTRCHNNRVEICNEDEDWNLVLDCDRLEPYEGEICCWDSIGETHQCMIPDDCGDEVNNDN